MQRGRHCIATTAPSRPKEALKARKWQLFRTKTARQNRTEKPFWKSRKALPAPKRRPTLVFLRAK